MTPACSAPSGLPGVVAMSPRRSGDRNNSALERQLVVSAHIYERVLGLADLAPLDSLPLPERTLSRAKTLGYNQIGQVRCAASARLAADFGPEHAHELIRALHDIGLRPEEVPLTGRDMNE